MYGMKTLSSGLQKAAGENLRSLINRVAYNDFSGVMTGTLLTLLVQSSTATSVLFVGLANAGLINLRQSITLIMGANIGTAIKALVIAYSGVNLNLESLALIIAAVALPILFSQRNNLRSISDILLGMAIMFLSLGVITKSLDNLDQNQALTDLLSYASGMGYGGILIALATGMVLTMIVQSSSAMMTLTIVLSGKGILSFEMAAAMIVGENIGTTITANLAAVVANRNAKRVALWHTLFNVFGAIIVMALFYPILDALDQFVSGATNHGSPYKDNEARTYALAFFHVGFNIASVLIFVWFTPQTENLLNKLIRDKEEDKNVDGFNLQYIQSGIIRSPELDMLEVKKSLDHFARINQQMFKASETLLTRNNDTQFQENLEKIHEWENYTDTLDHDITEFLNKVTENDISKTTGKTARAYLSTTNEMERMADSIYQVSKIYERKLQRSIWFNNEQREGIKKLMAKINLLMQDMNDLLQTGKFESRSAYEDRKANLFFMHDELKEKQLESVENPDFNVRSGSVFMDLLALYQRIGEQIGNVCENFRD
ncbi:MAG TPA: Na/Pi cotransporter family protein [Flavobacteriales bacterium]|nr:Na/Pi cotransporter family protein [Flavobacteriales bacterium]